MSTLFETTALGGLEIKNRFVRSATWEGMAAENGACTASLTELMTRLAEGEVGLIISSHIYVSPEGQATPWQLGIYEDALVAPLQRMTAAVHARNGRIVAQLAHAGRFANAGLTGKKPLAMSVASEKDRQKYKPAAMEDLQQLVSDFADAARRSREAGFDGLQLHAAHGYLFSQSLSPAFNQRSDRYGGPVENRARLLLEVLEKVRRTVGPDYPILVKLNSADFIVNGLEIDDSLHVGRMLQEAGIDAIEISGGTVVSGALSPVRANIDAEEKEAYFKEAAARFKAQLTVPLILVGGVRSLPVAEKLIAEGYSDYISMSRPFIREPHLVKRWQEGDLRSSTCISDNRCNQAARSGLGLHCVVEEKLKGKPPDQSA